MMVTMKKCFPTGTIDKKNIGLIGLNYENTGKNWEAQKYRKI